jgi:hypothetical protein
MKLNTIASALLAALALAPAALAGGGKAKTYQQEQGHSAFLSAVKASNQQQSGRSGIFQFGSFAPPKKGNGGGGGSPGGGGNNGGGNHGGDNYCPPPPPCDPPPFGAPEIDPNLAVAGLLLLVGGSLVLTGKR